VPVPHEDGRFTEAADVAEHVVAVD
jgi:hypothetical protein